MIPPDAAQSGDQTLGVHDIFRDNRSDVRDRLPVFHRLANGFIDLTK